MEAKKEERKKKREGELKRKGGMQIMDDALLCGHGRNCKGDRGVNKMKGGGEGCLRHHLLTAYCSLLQLEFENRNPRW